MGLRNLMWGHKIQSLQNSITTLAIGWQIFLVKTQATACIHNWSIESNACGTDLYVSACFTFHVCVLALESWLDLEEFTLFPLVSNFKAGESTKLTLYFYKFMDQALLWWFIVSFWQ